MIPGRKIGASGLLELMTPEEASNAQKIANAVGAAGRIAKSVLRNEPVMASTEEQRRRLTICAACEYYTGVTCKKCGCHIRFKARLQTEHCPLTPPKW